MGNRINVQICGAPSSNRICCCKSAAGIRKLLQVVFKALVSANTRIGLGVGSTSALRHVRQRSGA